MRALFKSKYVTVFVMWIIKKMINYASNAVPSLTIPTTRHFWKRQYWHRFLRRLSTGQFLLARQTYLAFFWTVLCKRERVSGFWYAMKRIANVEKKLSNTCPGQLVWHVSKWIVLVLQILISNPKLRNAFKGRTEQTFSKYKYVGSHNFCSPGALSISPPIGAPRWFYQDGEIKSAFNLTPGISARLTESLCSAYTNFSPKLRFCQKWINTWLKSPWVHIHFGNTAGMQIIKLRINGLIGYSKFI